MNRIARLALFVFTVLAASVAVSGPAHAMIAPDAPSVAAVSGASAWLLALVAVAALVVVGIVAFRTGKHAHATPGASLD